jgi:hypothetical protein
MDNKRRPKPHTAIVKRLRGSVALFSSKLKGTKKMKKLLATAAVLAIFTTQAAAISQEELREQYFECLHNAYYAYSSAWADACSRLRGGLNTNGSNCSLPAWWANSLNRDLHRAQDFCYQISTAGR